jgi:chlorite dismutase
MTYHSYIFFSVHPSFRKMSQFDQKAQKKLFIKTLQKEKNVLTYTYATLGLKVDTAFLLWFQSDSVDAIQLFLNKLIHTKLGLYLMINHTLFGMARPTQYSAQSTGHQHTERKGGKYLIIYPFTKNKEWYQLDFETRRKLMGGHVAIGKKYPQIEQLLLYSFGVDDSEFIVSYEMNDLLPFQSLVMDLRTDKVRSYTQKDTPIFTCIYKSMDEIQDFI